MTKFAKITGITLLLLLGLCFVSVLLVRFVFRDQVVNYLNGKRGEQKIELLSASVGYTADPAADYRFTYEKGDSALLRVRKYFQLDTLRGKTTWERALRLGRAVAQHIPGGFTRYTFYGNDTHLVTSNADRFWTAPESPINQ